MIFFYQQTVQMKKNIEFKMVWCDIPYMELQSGTIVKWKKRKRMRVKEMLQMWNQLKYLLIIE